MDSCSTHLKFAANLSQRLCHHQRVSALCSAALAVTLAWKRAICLSTMLVSHSAGESWYWLKPNGTRAGMTEVSARRMAVRLACLQHKEQMHAEAGGVGGCITNYSAMDDKKHASAC